MPLILSDEEVGRLQQLIAVGVAAARLEAQHVDAEDRAGPGTGGLGHRSGREDPRTHGREQRVRTSGGAGPQHEGRARAILWKGARKARAGGERQEELTAHDAWALPDVTWIPDAAFTPVKEARQSFHVDENGAA